MEANLNYSQATARQSWYRDSMRSKLMELIKEYPKANDGRLLQLFIERMREDDSYLIAAAEYAVTQNLETLGRRTKSPPSMARTATQKAEQQKTIDTLKESIKTQILMLNEIMPNGKRMRFCAGTEMIKMGGERTKEGAAWIRVGKKAGTKLVGQALNEKQVRECFK